MTVSIKVSYGELIDKITILEIKSRRVVEQAKLDNIRKELCHLLDVLNAHVNWDEETRGLMADLRQVNNDLWEVEDHLRDQERQQLFHSQFIALARSVYRLNDRRADIKKMINQKLKSEMVEEKSYTPYEVCRDLATIAIDEL